VSPAPARTSNAEILGAARALMESGGLEAVTMAAVAERVGVKAPSLYKRFADRTELLAAVASDVATDLGRHLARAVADSDPDPADRLEALADAYRSFAVAAPRSTALLFTAAAPGAEPSRESQLAAARPVLEVAEAMVGAERSLPAARVLTAFAYGFAGMEAAGAFRFGGDVDVAYRLGIATLITGLQGRDAPATRRQARGRASTSTDRG
jgi:AcrR family transcriptional regulator